MKVFYFSAFLTCFSASVFAQDLVYLANGNTVSGKVSEINADNIKLSSNASEGSSYGLDQVLLVTNSSGDYLILNGTKFNEQEKNAFLNAKNTTLPSNIIVAKTGDIISAESFIEKGNDLVYNYNGEEHSVKIGETAAVFRSNGSHKLYVSPGQAVIPLKAAKPKISTLVSILNDRPAPKRTVTNTAPAAKEMPSVVKEATPAPVKKETSAPVAMAVPASPAKEPGANPAPASEPKINLPASASSPDLKINMEAFSKKALAKTEEFSSYLQMISGVNNSRDKAMKSINMACDLFLNEEARVEVSSTNSQVKNKYKVRDYLNRLQFKSGQYDKIIIEYADINYASEFKKGADGNYYGVVTFVQKFRGFVDGEVVYGDITKRNLTIVLKQYEKAVEGGTQESWDVFLADVGVVETKKL